MGLFGKLGSTYVEIEGKTRPFEQSLGRVRAQTKAMTAGLGSLAAKAAAVFAGFKVAEAGARYLRGAVAAASDLSETASKVGVVFGKSQSIVLKAADEMARAFGAPKQEFLDAAAGFGLIGKAAGLSQADAAKLADKLARLGADAASFYNVPMEEALGSLRSGLVGEAEPLRRFGVLINEDALKAEALKLGLAGAKGELTEAAKVMTRASLITKGLADATGDLERTQDSFSNQLRKIEGQWTNLAAKVGGMVLPVFQSFAQSVGEVFGDLDGFVERNRGVVEAWAGKVAGIVRLLGVAWKQWSVVSRLAIEVVAEKIRQLGQVLGTLASRAFALLVHAATWAVGLIKNAFTALGNFLVGLFTDVGNRIGAQITNAINGALRGVPGLGQFAGPDLAVPKIADRSGLFSLDKLMPKMGAAPKLFEGLLDPLGKFGGRVRELVGVLGEARKKADADANDAKAKGGIGRLFRGLGGLADGRKFGNAIPELSPRDQLNRANRIAGRREFTGTQAEAQRILGIQRKREDDARKADISGTRRSALPGLFGAAAKSFAEKLGAGTGLAKVIGAAAAVATGGVGALGDAPTTRGRRGARGRVLPGSGEFQSQSFGLDDFARSLQSGILSRDKGADAAKKTADATTQAADLLGKIEQKLRAPGKVVAVAS